MIFCLVHVGCHLFQSSGNRPKKIDINKLKLKNVDKKLAETILGEIIDTGPRVDFNDIGKSSITGFQY